MFDDIVGRRFGRLIAKERIGKKWLCVCDCGNEKSVLPSNLKRERTRSCGCLHRESSARNGKANARHGYAGSPEYDAWSGMHQRCRNIKDKNYKSYGGRGIQVCEQWSTFDMFIADLGPKPSRHHSIDRIDVNGNYEPSNCKWATSKEQNGNKRSNIRVSAFGKTGCLADFISHHTPHYQIAKSLIRSGLDPAQAIVKAIGIAC